MFFTLKKLSRALLLSTFAIALSCQVDASAHAASGAKFNQPISDSYPDEEVSTARDIASNHRIPSTDSAAVLSRAPIKFLLTFDDGPSGSSFSNPSVQVLATLAHNQSQDGIKAIFFVQTRADRSGATEIGQQILRHEQAEGHVLAFHTATAGHSSHTSQTDGELAQSLQNGIADLTALTGAAPQLVRPPFWRYDERTFNAYRQYGLHLLLTDLSANDGKIWGVNFSLSKRHNMRKQLSAARKRWLHGELPVVDGVTPVVVTFHDLNRYTANVLDGYIHILLDVAQELDMPLAKKAFYDDKDALLRAALARTVEDGTAPVPLPGFWGWMWRIF